MNARDELVHKVRLSLIIDLGSIVTDHDADDAAHNVVALAEEHFKPRTITTAEELDALPGEVLVLTEQGGYWESIKRHDGKNWWKEPGGQNVSPSDDLTLPATVLHEGDAA